MSEVAQAIVGADESPFKLIEKGGAVKWQAWQLSSPEAIYFEIHDSKSGVVTMRIHDWILEQKCIPGGLLKAKLEYVANRWTALMRFPAIPLDNNRTEGQV